MILLRDMRSNAELPQPRAYRAAQIMKGPRLFEVDCFIERGLGLRPVTETLAPKTEDAISALTAGHSL